jgi:uncharacterized protein YijF (DUF1287 family)
LSIKGEGLAFPHFYTFTHIIFSKHISHFSFMRARYIIPSLLIVAIGAGIAHYAPRYIPISSLEKVLPELGNSRVALKWLTPSITRVNVADPIAQKIVAAAHAQVGDVYDASYQKISFPNGDVKPKRGACTDVVVRALRGAGFDLQDLINADMKRSFKTYPNSWRLDRPDKNIDHRRVPNQMVFFERHGISLPLGTTGKDLTTWQPGDIVCWRMKDNRLHTGIISDGISERGMPTVIHNGWRCMEQDVLDFATIIGHYRFPKQEA